MDKNKAYKYMALAETLAREFSKDTSTKVGAIIVGPNAEITTGYNGSPRGCSACGRTTMAWTWAKWRSSAEEAGIVTHLVFA